MTLYNCQIELNIPVYASNEEEARYITHKNLGNESIFP
jgi:hypothetical protein